MLTDCTPDAVRFIARRTSILEEAGAGTGWWADALRAAGVAVRALDPRPRGPSVEVGTHADITPGAVMLIVWPPDMTDIYQWVSQARPPLLFVVGQGGRFKTDCLADHYAVEASITIPGEIKGPATLTAWRQLTVDIARRNH